MENSTVYDVQIRYSLTDQTSSGLSNMTAQAQKAENSLGSLTKGVMAFAASAAIVDRGKRAFVDFNSEVEQSKITIAAISRMFGQSGDWQTAMTGAEAQFQRYQNAAKISTATTKEFLEMHLSLAPTFAKFHAAQRDIENIVQGAVVAAPILGERPEIFAMDVKQMLQGSVQLRDRSAISLLSMMGIDRAEFNRRTQADINYAIDVVKRALTSPALMEARKAQETSFAGVFSTLEDTLQITLGQIGIPLFREITGEIQRWNNYLSENQPLVDRYVHEFGQGLKSGFAAIRDAVSFIVEHKDAILHIAAVWIGLRAAGGLSGILGLGGGGMPQLAGSLGTLLSGRLLGGEFGTGTQLAKSGPAFGSMLAGAGAGYMFSMLGGQSGLDKFSGFALAAGAALSQIPGPVGLIATAATAAAGGIKLWTDAIDDSRKKEIEAKADIAGMMDAAQRFTEKPSNYGPSDFDRWRASAAELSLKVDNGVKPEWFDAAEKMQAKTLGEMAVPLLTTARSLGMFNPETGAFNEKKWAEKMIAGGTPTDEAARIGATVAFVAKVLQQIDPEKFGRLTGMQAKAVPDSKTGSKTHSPNVNVTIHRIEVYDKNPDAFVHGAIRSFRRIAKNPTQAKSALWGGY